MASTLYDNDRAYSNSWLVYINGLEIPSQAVSVTYGVWQMPTASISVVPDPILHRLGAEDRVSVQVFYCDQWYHDPPQFCLLFDGEITAWGMTSTSNMRALNFTCIDYMAILTQLFFFFMSSYDDMAVGVSNQAIGVMGSTVELAGYGALYPYSLFSQGLADVGDGRANNATIKRPIDFAYNVVRALIKAQHPDRPVPAANFFAPWVKKTNFHRRWVAVPYFDADPDNPNATGVFPILRAVQDESALAAASRMASTTGNAGSMWDMIAELLKTMLMEIVMLPTPAAVRAGFTTMLPEGPALQGQGQIFLTNYFVKPQLFFGLPPACNVFFPSQIVSYAYEENIATQPTRMYFNEERLLQYLNQNGGNNGLSAAGNSLAQDAMCTGFPEEVDIAARDAVSSAGQNGKNLLVYPEEFFKGPVIDRRAMPRWFSFLLDSMRVAPGEDGETQPADESANTPTEVDNDGRVSRVLTQEEQDQLMGATDALYNVTRHDRFAATFQRNVPAYGPASALDPNVINYLRGWRRDRTGDIGQVDPPQRSPFEGTVSQRINISGAGAFWATRGSGSNNHIHAGHDIAVPTGTAVYATVPGVIELVVKTLTERPDRGGRRVYIRDKKNGLHRFMHFSEIDPSLSNGKEIPAGRYLGKSGGSGLPENGRTGEDAFSPHLHYDITTSRDYRLNYTDRLNSLLAGRDVPALGTGVPTTAPAPPPAPAGTTTQPVATTPTNTANPPQPNPATAQIASYDTTRNLYKLYAAYEYYKERYSRRQGAVTMAFNPYPVPGFPCAIFDRRSTALDTFGYIMSVRHQLSPQGWQTDVAFSHGRTFQEMFALMQRRASLEALTTGQNAETIRAAVRNRANGPRDPNAGGPVPPNSDEILAGIPRNVGAIAVAPAEPLEEIRAVIQNFAKADEFYKSLFYRSLGPGMAVLEVEQYQRARATEGAVASTNINPYQVANAIANDPGDNVETIIEANNEALREQGSSTRVGEPPVAADRLPLRGVFYYPEVVQMLLPEGEPVAISIEGIDSGTANRLLSIIDKVRNGVASAAEINALINYTGQASFPENVQIEPNQSVLEDPIPPPPEPAVVQAQELGERREIQQQIFAGRNENLQ